MKKAGMLSNEKKSALFMGFKLHSLLPFHGAAAVTGEV